MIYNGHIVGSFAFMQDMVNFLWNDVLGELAFQLKQMFVNCGLNFSYVFASIAITYAVYRFIISPFLVGSGSDIVSRHIGKNKVKEK